MPKQELVVLGQDEGGCCPTLLAAPLDEKQAVELAKVFKALGDPVRLRQAGLIDCERRGTWVYYWLLPGTVDKLAGVLTRPGQPAASECSP
ncbi:hypothetical protein CG717_03015 [Streptomyces sp. CB02613]|uniref:ArsR/SmtB family transcription factor n=1 Tax=Streptomyces sp. CB02613 TaxID=2020328 RepID=UPI000C277DD0|nr:helix-turn-helix transcriptional regulator [Streptomyces sp. CB02613]PJN35217.1 hypothetical protein CG717_03015 [Streptomyces sp. CB02613]